MVSLCFLSLLLDSFQLLVKFDLGGLLAAEGLQLALVKLLSMIQPLVQSCDIFWRLVTFLAILNFSLPPGDGKFDSSLGCWSLEIITALLAPIYAEVGSCNLPPFVLGGRSSIRFFQLQASFQ